jgi:hypothetical protein
MKTPSQIQVWKEHAKELEGECLRSTLNRFQLIGRIALGALVPLHMPSARSLAPVRSLASSVCSRHKRKDCPDISLISAEETQSTLIDARRTTEMFLSKNEELIVLDKKSGRFCRRPRKESATLLQFVSHFYPASASAATFRAVTALSF